MYVKPVLTLYLEDAIIQADWQFYELVLLLWSLSLPITLYPQERTDFRQKNYSNGKTFLIVFPDGSAQILYPPYNYFPNKYLKKQHKT